MDSLRSIASCIGVTGTFSVARDFFGFLRGAPSDVSVLTQVRRLQGRHVHMNFILVGSDQFTTVTWRRWTRRSSSRVIITRR